MAQNALKRELKENPVKKDDFNFVKVDLDEEGIDVLMDELSSLPIGYDRKLVVVNLTVAAKKKKKGPSDLDPFYEWLENPDPTIDCFVVAIGEIDAKHPLAAAVTKGGGNVREVKPFTDGDWMNYIPKWFSARGIGIETDAISELIARIEGDYARFLSEGSKLVAYKGGHGNISKQEVESLVHKPIEDSSFALTDALFSKDRSKVMPIYAELRESGVEPIALSRMILKQLTFLSKIRYLLSNGTNPEMAASELGVHQYRARLASKTVSRLSKADIDRGVEAIHDFEKSVLTGEKDAEIAFLECLASLT